MTGVMGRIIGDELTKLWGFENCRDIKIHIPSQGIVTITAEFKAEKEQMDQCKAIIKKYRLEEIPEEGEQKA